MIGLAALLVGPSPMIVVFVIVPAVAVTSLVAIVAAVLALPLLTVRRFHRHRSAHAHQRVLGARRAHRS